MMERDGVEIEDNFVIVRMKHRSERQGRERDSRAIPFESVSAQLAPGRRRAPEQRGLAGAPPFPVLPGIRA